MALVAYDNSDSSEYEDEDNDSPSALVLKPQVEASDSQEASSSVPTLNGKEESHRLFTQLPQPSTKRPAVIEEDDEFLHKKEKPDLIKPKAKITVPSLSDFKDVESTPIPKPKITNGKKSGLLGILPQPRNAVISKTTSLVPQQLKKPAATVKKKEPLPTPVKKTKKDNVLVNNYSDDSDDEEVQSDFFSINKPADLPIEDIDVPLDIDKPNEVPQSQKPKGIESYFKKEEPKHIELQPDYEEFQGVEAGSSYSHMETGQRSNNDEVVLDEEAIRKLCGARGKRKREDIQIVDVNQQEVLANSREWLIKGLMDDTTKRVSSSKRKGDEPTSQQRRKHQITYLAHQAKANEADLQNQWANNRMSKRQTQSKYGF